MENSSKIYVLYHYPCTDGTGARYAASKFFGDKATYLGVNYGKPMPEIEDNSEVYIIDFSYPKNELRALNDRVKKLVVLDHHKTAQEDLKDEPYAIFDMNRSGAVLAWNYFFPGEEVPSLLKMVQDRDLWQWKIPGSKDVLNYLSLEGADYSIENWDRFISVGGFMFQRGKIISRYKDKQVDSACKEDKLKFFNLDGDDTVISNNFGLHSEIGSKLCALYPIKFSITYFVDPNGVVVLSFRSIGEFDVSEVAKKYGGGGHRNAAGSRISLSKLQEWLK